MSSTQAKKGPQPRDHAPYPPPSHQSSSTDLRVAVSHCTAAVNTGAPSLPIPLVLLPLVLLPREGVRPQAASQLPLCLRHGETSANLFLRRGCCCRVSSGELLGQGVPVVAIYRFRLS